HSIVGHGEEPAYGGKSGRALRSPEGTVPGVRVSEITAAGGISAEQDDRVRGRLAFGRGEPRRRAQYGSYKLPGRHVPLPGLVQVKAEGSSGHHALPPKDVVSDRRGGPRDGTEH